MGYTLTALVIITWLFVIFGEHRLMAQLIAKGVFISSLIHKDFPDSPRFSGKITSH